jgi:hypothetical protein
VLNTRVFLFDVMPMGSSIYDLITPGVVWPESQSTSYALEAQGEEGSRLFYQRVPELGYRPPDMYREAFDNVSLDTCAQYCVDEYGDW